jgi:hypothetical protein
MHLRKRKEKREKEKLRNDRGGANRRTFAHTGLAEAGLSGIKSRIKSRPSTCKMPYCIPCTRDSTVRDRTENDNRGGGEWAR